MQHISSTLTYTSNHICVQEEGKPKQNSLQRLQGVQVGKKRVEHEFQQIQLRKASKVKKEDAKEGLEAVDLKHRPSQSQRGSVSPARPAELQKRDSFLSVKRDSELRDIERAEIDRSTTPTELERRTSMRV